MLKQFCLCQNKRKTEYFLMFCSELLIWRSSNALFCGKLWTLRKLFVKESHCCIVVVSKSVYYVPFLVLWYYLPLQKTQRTISVLGVGWFHLNCMMHLKQGHVLQRDNRDLWSTGGGAAESWRIDSLSLYRVFHNSCRKIIANFSINMSACDFLSLLGANLRRIFYQMDHV